MSILESICPVCGSEKSKPQNKYCSYKCRNIIINKNKDYNKQNAKSHATLKLNNKSLILNKESICKCGKSFISKSNTKGVFHQLFCSISCANTRIHSDKTKAKISNSIIKIIKETGKCGFINKAKRIFKESICKECGIEYNSKNLYCSRICLNKAKRKDIEPLKIYRTQCRFQFNLADYKREFDFSLIEKYGWYSPSNKKDNLGGVSRDHMFSVKEGFLLNIDPNIISHPANCCLLKHTDNISKNYRSTITLEELLERIKNFNNKYNL